MRLTEPDWQTAIEHCTPLQLEALDYWRHGYGYKRISIILGIPRETARSRIDRALTTIRIRTLAHPTPGDTITTAKPRSTKQTRTHTPRP